MKIKRSHKLMFQKICTQSVQSTSCIHTDEYTSCSFIPIVADYKFNHAFHLNYKFLIYIKKGFMLIFISGIFLLALMKVHELMHYIRKLT